MSEKIQTVYPQEIWDAEHVRDRFQSALQSDQVRNWMDSHTQGITGRNSRVFEVGCFPGRYLAYFGERGFELNGVDLTPRVTPEMKDWLCELNYSIGRIEKGDFFEFKDDVGFDVVLSNGFIEHFEDWSRCLERHLDLVKSGGLLLLSAPNFVGGLQNFLHRWLDRENYDRHFLPAMDPDAWAQVARSRGFEVLKTEYFDRFDFWNGPQPRPVWQKLVSRGIQVLLVPLRILFPRNSRWSSPYCGMVARRR